MILASFSSIEKSYPSQKVLKGVSGAVKKGDRIALLGSNGTGKTTLLEILAGRKNVDSGSLEIPGAISTGYLPQDIDVSGGMSLFDYATGGMQDLIAMRDRINEIHHSLSEGDKRKRLLSELGELQNRFEELGGYHMDDRVREVLTGLGFETCQHTMILPELSGGMRNRAALARLLCGPPDLLLLDEPTNHLDIGGLEFLESYLIDFEGGVIFVSHDRAFIRNTATAIWEMADGRILTFPGGYDKYLIEREKRRESLMKSYLSQREFIARTEDFIRRNIAGQKTKQAQSRRRMLAKLRKLEKPSTVEDAASIKFTDVGRSARIVVKCENASFSYDNNPFIENLDFVIERGERIGMFGPNGSGKTTVLKLIMGELSPKSGSIELGHRLSIGYFDQMAEDLDPEISPIAVIKAVKPEWNEPQIRSFLGKFLFSGEDVFRRVGSFSGGEQSRLILARIIAKEPNFLVLDEPTNHLDIESREVLETAMAEYNGTVVCVSHDREFLDSFAEKLMVVDIGSATIFLGNYSYYRQKMQAADAMAAKPISASGSEKPARKSRKRGVNPQIIMKIKNEIDELEGVIAELETAISGMETSSDWEKIWTLTERRNEHYAELEKLYEKMETLIENVD
jgi:ATP-binding cassette subfamily F protein 3